METNANVPTKLSNMQVELLKLYAHNVSDSELRDIKKMLAEYFAKKMDDEMDRLWEEKGWDEKTIDQWKNEHMRTPIK
jgi:hypothetical protein